MIISKINTFQNSLNTYRLNSLSRVSMKGKSSFYSEDDVDESDEFEKKYSSLDVYISSIRNFERISKEEEVLLAKKIQAGGEEAEQAKNKLVKANLMLVVDRALKRYITSHKLDIMDYIQEGNIALNSAAKKYDGKNAFSTFAVTYIDGRIRNAEVNQSKTIRIPIYLKKYINDIVRARAALLNKLMREPTLEEISKQANLTISQINELRKINAPIEYLQRNIVDDKEFSCMVEDKKVVSPVQVVEKNITQEHIKSLLENLSERSRQILILRFGLFDNEPHTLIELAPIFHVSRQRIQGIIDESLKILRKKSPELAVYLEDEKQYAKPLNNNFDYLM